MPSQWFCSVAGDEVGPLSDDELIDMARRGAIDLATNVRQDGGDWIPAARVSGLASVLQERQRKLDAQSETIEPEKADAREFFNEQVDDPKAFEIPEGARVSTVKASTPKAEFQKGELESFQRDVQRYAPWVGLGGSAFLCFLSLHPASWLGLLVHYAALMGTCASGVILAARQFWGWENLVKPVGVVLSVAVVAVWFFSDSYVHTWTGPDGAELSDTVRLYNGDILQRTRHVRESNQEYSSTGPMREGKPHGRWVQTWVTPSQAEVINWYWLGEAVNEPEWNRRAEAEP